MTNYEEVQAGRKADVSWGSKENPLSKGDTMEGRYIEVSKGAGRAEGFTFHLFERDDKKVVSVLGTTVLNTKLGTVAIGKMVKIEYLGLVSSEKSGRQYKDYKVFQGIDHPEDEGQVYSPKQNQEPPPQEFPPFDES